jgi:hypothetical protein
MGGSAVVLYIHTDEKQMRIDIRCPSAPWENRTTDLDKAYDIAYNLSEEYQCDVDLWYNSTNTLYTTVSAY